MPTREEMKAEAIKRMRLMRIFPQTVNQFDKSDLVNISEPPLGGFFWADDFQKEIIKKFEEENDALVYMGVMSYTHFGKLLTLLFVSKYKREWRYDRRDLSEKLAVAYVYNYDHPDSSECGSIGFEYTTAASILRTW